MCYFILCGCDSCRKSPNKRLKMKWNQKRKKNMKKQIVVLMIKMILHIVNGRTDLDERKMMDADYYTQCPNLLLRFVFISESFFFLLFLFRKHKSHLMARKWFLCKSIKKLAVTQSVILLFRATKTHIMTYEKMLCISKKSNDCRLFS